MGTLARVAWGLASSHTATLLRSSLRVAPWGFAPSIRLARRGNASLAPLQTKVAHWTHTLSFMINGESVQVERPDTQMTLLSFLRGRGLTGAKLGCGEGGCGACTVMVSYVDVASGKPVHRAVDSCLFPLCHADGMHITTIEGIGSTRTGLHPVQERIAQSDGTQCGFCTPGIAMSAYALLAQHSKPTAAQMEASMDGNLCRCTGYRSLLDALLSFTPDGHHPNRPGPLDTPLDPLPRAPTLRASPLHFQGDFGEWFRPVDLATLLEIKTVHPHAQLSVGSSEIGVDRKMKGTEPSVLIDPTLIPEMNVLAREDDILRVGAAAPLTSLQEFLATLRDEVSPAQNQTVHALMEQLEWFAGPQIRNAACLGGNVVNASPIADMPPVLMATNATLRLARSGGSMRTVPLRTFFKDYKSVAKTPEEVVVDFLIPLSRPLEFVEAFKICRRKEDGISIVNAGLRLWLEKEGETESRLEAFRVKEASFNFGGVAAIPVAATKAETFLVGKTLTDDTLQGVLEALTTDVSIPENAPGGMVEYRQSIVHSFFYRFIQMIRKHLDPDSVSAREVSATEMFKRHAVHGRQDFVVPPSEVEGGVHQPVMHRSAFVQVAGEARYIDDMPNHVNGLFGALVQGTKPHAKILHVDPSEALTMPGVIDFVSAADVPGKNNIGDGICPTGLVYDEECFAQDEVTFLGQPIGLLVADSHENAQRAARHVHIEYEELPAVLTIKEARAAKSFLPCGHSVERGAVTPALADSDRVLAGDVWMGGQEHFYLEPQTSLAIPGDNGEMKVFASTQNPTKTQHFVAHVLGVPENRVVCVSKRMGGGFGGKETRSINFSCHAAVAAHKLNRPVRLVLDRAVDMGISGARHPYYTKYKAGFSDDGQFRALDVTFFSNGGCSYDLSIPVMDRSLFHIDNAYFIPNLRANGEICKTNLPSNTAYRGFGAPQAMFTVESVIERVARDLDVPPHVVSEKNLYHAGEATHYKMDVPTNNLRTLWAQCKESSEFDTRWKDVEGFNEERRWRKRGMAILPVKFGISFTAKFLNQASALVHVYTDGSVLVSHGGTEMGQGLHTKMAQVAATELGVPLSKVHIVETATDKCANTSPTAASASSDMYGEAVRRACVEIRGRLESLRRADPNLSWEKLVNVAYFDRIDLSARGFYKVPDIGFDFKTQTGKPFRYFTNAVAASEVELDVLTGEFHPRRVDIAMDVGQSLNPTLDIGQIEGAFAQGMGWATMEEVVWGSPEYGNWLPPGRFFSNGPGNYKIPGFVDVPTDFRVSLMKGAQNPNTIHSSKAIGEPPFFLGASVFFAVKEAIYSARREEGLKGWFALDLPATVERVRMACADRFTRPFADPTFRAKGSF